MLHEKDETGSTNDDAKALASQGAPHGTAVLARRQRHGRGRAGRPFLSPEGGLYLSVVVRPRAAPRQWSLLPLAAGAHVAAALRLAGFPAVVKWPNDILLGGDKLAGILVESTWGQRPFAIVGLGINVERAPIAGATSLRAHGEPPAWRELAERLRAAIVAACDQLDAGGADAVLPDVRALCVTLGKRISWENGDGVAVDVAEDGALVVEANGGARQRVLAGDVRIEQA